MIGKTSHTRSVDLLAVLLREYEAIWELASTISVNRMLSLALQLEALIVIMIEALNRVFELESNIINKVSSTRFQRRGCDSINVLHCWLDQKVLEIVYVCNYPEC